MPGDVGAIALAAVGRGGWVDLATFLNYGPSVVVHLLHDRPQIAAASLALRFALAYFGGLAGGAAAAPAGSDKFDPRGGTVGTVVGMGIAALIDEILLARD